MLNNESKNHETDVTSDPAMVIQSLENQLADLKKQLARGTREIQPPPDLVARIEHYLRSHICTTAELAKALDEDRAKVTEKLKVIRKNLADVGTPEEARWIWRVGDETSAKELKDVVGRLIEGHAMTTAELTKITGARMSRVNGVLVELQRDPNVPIYDLGTSFRAKWLILPKGARPANLPPKGKKQG